MAEKSIIVLARRNHEEAMRVAAGMTIFGHEVRLIFMSRPLTQEQASGEQAELLELAEIEPETTVVEMANDLIYLSPVHLGEALATSDCVVNI